MIGILGDEPLTPLAADLLTAEGNTVAIAAAPCSARDAAGKPETADVNSHRLSSQLVTAPFDPTVGAALAAAGSDPASPSYLDHSLAIPLKHDSTTARRQGVMQLTDLGTLLEHVDDQRRGSEQGRLQLLFLRVIRTDRGDEGAR